MFPPKQVIFVMLLKQYMIAQGVGPLSLLPPLSFVSLLQLLCVHLFCSIYTGDQQNGNWPPALTTPKTTKQLQQLYCRNDKNEQTNTVL